MLERTKRLIGSAGVAAILVTILDQPDAAAAGDHQGNQCRTVSEAKGGCEEALAPPPGSGVMAAPAEAAVKSCIPLFRADYCGDGTSWTVKGTSIWFNDKNQWPDPPVPGFFREAAWSVVSDKTQLTCLSKLRWTTISPFLPGMNLCPAGFPLVIDPRSEKGSKTVLCENFEVNDNKTWLLSKSRFLDRPLYTWTKASLPAVGAPCAGGIRRGEPKDECMNGACPAVETYTSSQFRYGSYDGGWCLQRIGAGTHEPVKNRGLAKFEGAIYEPETKEAWVAEEQRQWLVPLVTVNESGRWKTKALDSPSFGGASPSAGATSAALSSADAESPLQGHILSRKTPCGNLPGAGEGRTTAIPLYGFEKGNESLVTTDVPWACSNGFNAKSQLGYVVVRLGPIDSCPARPSPYGAAELTFAEAGCQDTSDEGIKKKLLNLCNQPIRPACSACPKPENTEKNTRWICHCALGRDLGRLGSAWAPAMLLFAAMLARRLRSRQGDPR
jgi:hypothetical protein